MKNTFSTPLALVVAVSLAGCVSEGEVSQGSASLPVAPVAEPVSEHVDELLVEGFDLREWRWNVTRGHTNYDVSIRLVPIDGLVGPRVVPEFCFEAFRDGQSFARQCPSFPNGGAGTGVHGLMAGDRVYPGEWLVRFKAEPGAARFVMDVQIS